MNCSAASASSHESRTSAKKRRQANRHPSTFRSLCLS
jgi:hypothetical protein